MKNPTKLMLSLIVILSCGCGSIKVDDNVSYEAPIEESLLAHMLPLDKDGNKDCSIIAEPEKKYENINCSPDGNDQGNPQSKHNIDKHIALITAGLKQAIDDKEHKNVELLLFVHGGLNSRSVASEAAREILGKIAYDNAHRNDNNAPYIYPIFVNWRSGMIQAYGDHVWRVRQGQESKYLGPISFPFYLIADLGRALSRTPVTLGYQGYNYYKSFKEEDDWINDSKNITNVNKEFYDKNESHDGHAIWIGENTKNKWTDKLWNNKTFLVPGILKLVTTPFLDGIGKSGWDNMLRDTKLLFRSTDDYSLYQVRDTRSYRYRNSSGGLSILMRALGDNFKKYQSPPEGQNKLSVTLMGHSMGTIVMSELLRRFSNDKDLIYSNIVYMAAACTVRDFEDTVIPYLSKHKETNFYNLTLHPTAEENEDVSSSDLVSRGSLLVWIDNFASNPATRTDLTLGRWENAQKSWPFIPNNVRNRITLKAFGIEDPHTNRGEGCKKPQTHGEFNDADTYFWRRDFWLAQDLKKETCSKNKPIEP